MLKFELNSILQFVSYEVIMLRNFFLDHSSPLCPHMGFFINGVVERKIRHLVEIARTLLLHHKGSSMFFRGCYLSRLLFD